MASGRANARSGAKHNWRQPRHRPEAHTATQARQPGFSRWVRYASKWSVEAGGGDDCIKPDVMRFMRQVLAQLFIPGQPDCAGARMRGQPAVVMAAALAQTPSIGSKADQGHEQHVRFPFRSEEHTSELPSLKRRSYAVFCFK